MQTKETIKQERQAKANAIIQKLKGCAAEVLASFDMIEIAYLHGSSPAY